MIVWVSPPYIYSPPTPYFSLFLSLHGCQRMCNFSMTCDKNWIVLKNGRKPLYVLAPIVSIVHRCALFRITMLIRTWLSMHGNRFLYHHMRNARWNKGKTQQQTHSPNASTKMPKTCTIYDYHYWCIVVFKIWRTKCLSDPLQHTQQTPDHTTHINV